MTILYVPRMNCLPGVLLNDGHRPQPVQPRGVIGQDVVDEGCPLFGRRQIGEDVDDVFGPRFRFFELSFDGRNFIQIVSLLFNAFPPFQRLFRYHLNTSKMSDKGRELVREREKPEFK